MKEATATELIADSQQNCFFCYQSKLCPASLESMQGGKYHPNPSLHSLHYLCRYLGMNIGEMFNPSQINVTLEAQRPFLQVYLCNECSEENTMFGKLYKQFEKIEMELMSSLETIHMKLATGKKARIDSHPVHDFNEKLELVQTVREKTMEKCFSKLKNDLPRITIKKHKQIGSPRRIALDNKGSSEVKNTADLQTDPSNRHNDEFDSVATAAVKVEYVKVENSTAQDEMSDESGNNDWLDDSTNSTSEGDDVQQFKLPPGTENVKNIIKTDGESPKEVAGGHSYVIIRPTKLDENLLKPMKMQSIVDSQTGQRKCLVCSRTFVRTRGFQNHYRCKHLNEKYKCTLRGCNKTFNSQSTYYAHHQQMHMGKQFICKVCRRCFGDKSNFNRHHRKTRCGKGLALSSVKHSYYCRICEKGFTLSDSLRRHHRTTHLQLKSFECNLCGRKFMRNDYLIVHLRNIHQKRKNK